MRIVLSSLALPLLLSVSPAYAAQPDQQQAQSGEAPAAVQEKAEEPKKICRRVAVQTGSRQRERLCMTSEQWREFNRGN